MGLVDASSWRTSRLERRAEVPKGWKVDHPRSDSMLDMEAASVASAPTWTENGRTPPGSTPPPQVKGTARVLRDNPGGVVDRQRQRHDRRCGTTSVLGERDFRDGRIHPVMRRRAGGEWRVGREPGNVIDVLNPLTEDPLTLVKCTRVLVGSAELSRPDLTIASIVSLFLFWKL